MKKIKVVCLVVGLCISLCACQSTGKRRERKTNTDSQSVETVTNSEEETREEKTSETVESHEEETSTIQSEEETSTEETTSTQVTEKKKYYQVILSYNGENKVQVIKQFREVTEVGLKEAKTAVDAGNAIVKLFTDEDEAKEAVASLEKGGATASIVEVEGNFDVDNVVRIERVFKLSNRGDVTVAGYKSDGTMKLNQDVAVIKKDGTVLYTKVSYIEVVREVLEETRSQESLGMDLLGISKDDIEAGDIVIALASEDENDKANGATNESGQNFYGAYAGTPFFTSDLTCQFEEVFNKLKETGWKVASSSWGASSEKYKEGTSIYFTTCSSSIGIMLNDMPNKYMYTADLYINQDNDDYQISWSGLTWGASIDEIEAIYGSPYQESNDHCSVTYIIKVDDRTEIMFRIGNDDTDKPGLMGVTVWVTK